jgi:alpha-galactosidase
MQVDIRYENHTQSIPMNHWEITGTNTEEITDPQHGMLAQLSASSNFEFFGLQMQVAFALARTEPLFLWKIKIANRGENPVWINKIEFLRAGGQSQHGSLRFSENPIASGWSFYSNGWQSWSHTGTYLPGQAMRISRLGRFQQPMVVNPGTPLLRLPGYYTSEFFGAISDLNSGAGLVIGFLSQKQHFGTVEAVLYDKPSLALFTADGSLLESGTVLETDWAVISPFSITDPDPFRVYLEAVARENEVKRIPEQSVPSGWCSWYQYYTNLNARDIQNHLALLDANRPSLPLELLQIDDGFEQFVGDWFTFKPGFPDGVAPLAGEIHDRGLTPGLWLAPFILDRRSRFFREHQEFILRNRRGQPVNAGWVLNAFTAAMELPAPGAL